jgi:hypothetical protein
VLRPPAFSFRAPWSWVGSVLDGSAGRLDPTALAGRDWTGALGVTVITTTVGEGTSPALDGVGVTRTVCTTVSDGAADGAVTVTMGVFCGGAELGGGAATDDWAGAGALDAAGGGFDEAAGGGA